MYTHVHAHAHVPCLKVLNFSSFFLANRHARLFLFGYIVCLHLLVSCSTYLITHHTHSC